MGFNIEELSEARMTTLKQQLTDLAAHKHSDLSIGNDAVDYIEELEANLAEAAKGLDYYEEVLLLRKKVEKYETTLQDGKGGKI